MSTVSPNATGLPSNDNKNFLPLNADLVEMLSADMWNHIGRTCRVALVGNRLSEADYVNAMGELIDDDPRSIGNLFGEREKHRKALQRVLVMLRKADQRDNVALDKALAARGH